MKNLILLLLCLPWNLIAHGGDDHTHEASTIKSNKYFSVESNSDKYEVLLKYGPITPGQTSTLNLFISEFISNKPLDSIKLLNVTVTGHSGIPKINPIKIESGWYELPITFPSAQDYNLQIQIDGLLGPDLIQLNEIEVGKALEEEEVTNATSGMLINSNWIFGVIGLLMGGLFMYLIQKIGNKRLTTLSVLILCLLPTYENDEVFAHGDEPHGATAASSGATEFLVEKEAQFLYHIETVRHSIGNVNTSSALLGTVVPSPLGRAIVQSPQTGSIISIRAIPGQTVHKGQVLAILDQQIDAATQINMLSEKNSIHAEYDAAKIQYDRLKSIEDIVAQKELIEAKSRMDKAGKNKALLDANTGAEPGLKRIQLIAPIDGIVSPYQLAIGSIVSAGQQIFELSNLNQLFIEAQVYDQSALSLRSDSEVYAITNAQNKTHKLKVVQQAQSVFEGNQAQKILFEIIKPEQQFKLGERVTLRIENKSSTRHMVVDRNTITEVGGRPCVFLKYGAEHFGIRFIVLGDGNEAQVPILEGFEDHDRIVHTQVYQMKMMYLNQ